MGTMARVASKEGDQDPGIAVTRDERVVGPAVHGRDLQHPGEPRRGAAEERGRPDEPADRQTRDARRAHVAAHDAGREPERGAHEEHT